MIIWLSGAYGVGKSTVAEALRRMLGNARIIDLESLGTAVRDNYPDCPNGYIFEDYPLWAEFSCKLIEDVQKHHCETLLVDMTLVRDGSRIAVLERLKADGFDVRFVVLTASRQTVHERILARGEEEDCWCMENLDMALKASAAIPGAFHVNTDGVAVEEIVEEILNWIRQK